MKFLVNDAGARIKEIADNLEDILEPGRIDLDEAELIGEDLRQLKIIGDILKTATDENGKAI